MPLDLPDAVPPVLPVPVLPPEPATVPSSPATPIGERVPRGAVWPRPLVEAGLYERGFEWSGGAGRFDPDEPEDFDEPELEPDPVFPDEPPDFDEPVDRPSDWPLRELRVCCACSLKRDMKPERFLGSGGGFAPEAIAASSR